MSLLKLEIISPKGFIFKGNCHLAVIPAIDGDMGIMFDHESLITSLREGRVEVFDEQEKLIKSVDITGGFAEMHAAEKLVVLVD